MGDKEYLKEVIDKKLADVKSEVIEALLLKLSGKGKKDLSLNYEIKALNRLPKITI